MTKTMLLAAAAMLAGGAAVAATPSVSHQGTVAPAAAPKAGTIVNQTSGSTGNGIVSQNFESTFQQYDSAGADAFVIKTKAKVQTVVAAGTYFNGSGPATGEDVTFYKDSKGKPAKKAIANCTYKGVKGKDASGTFTIKLPKACNLKKGTYWVSVVADLAFSAGGEWGWNDATETGPYQADWENPGNGFATGCTTWGVETTCVPAGQDNGKYYQLLGKGS